MTRGIIEDTKSVLPDGTSQADDSVSVNLSFSHMSDSKGTKPADPEAKRQDSWFGQILSELPDKGLSLRPLESRKLMKGLERHLRLPISLPTVDFPNLGPGSTSEFYNQAPIWTYEPFRSVYTTMFIMYMGTLYLPFRAISNLPPQNRPRPSWSWKKAMMISLTRRCTLYMCKTHIMLAGKPAKRPPPPVNTSMYVKVDPDEVLQPVNDREKGDIRGELARAMEIQQTKIATLCGYFYTATGAPPTTTYRAEPHERLLLHFHGGAYWMGTAQESGLSAKFCSDLLARIQEKDGSIKRAFQMEFRLTRHDDPTFGYPAALLDALVGYLYLIRVCGFEPKNIVMSGDSSGGNLALALCRYLRDEGVADLPVALLLLSPWCDISRSHSGPVLSPNAFSTTVLNCKSDVIDASLLYRNTSVNPLLGRLPAEETYINPYISPVSLQLDPSYGSNPPHWGFAGFPKHVYISTGSAELNYEQHLTLAYRMAEGSVRGVPLFAGNNLERHEDEPHQCVWRSDYPRAPAWVARHDTAVKEGTSVSSPLDQRDVVLDDTKDGVHILPLFKWFEPERSQVLDRITSWICDFSKSSLPNAPVISATNV